VQDPIAFAEPRPKINRNQQNPATYYKFAINAEIEISVWF